MTTVMRSAAGNLGDKVQTIMSSGNMSVLLYADDTLLSGRDQGSLHQLLDDIVVAGAQVGMELHWGKIHMMKIRSDVQLRTPAGQRVAGKPCLTYLGATLYNTGQLSTELKRRIDPRVGRIL
mmetsp:Transcript_26015/g.72600  ORF Transcript_26015/g.72600 Transcript_26015/m.72600 type:complete len:122 (-) Transcript_26015:176-541(-)